MTLPSLAGAQWLERPETQRVLAVIEAAGFSARVVGGCVRNALMGLPVTDIDIATTAPPDEVQRAAGRAGLATVPTGIVHGTVTVINHLPFEVTTLRRDVTTDGRRATVAFTDDWVEDASRRDFTMNALYCDARGTVFDPLNGYADLAARCVRFIGSPEQRLSEDYLRILRFFRFHAAYGLGALDAAGAAACVRLRAGLAQLSPERVGAEMLRLLAARGAVAAVEAMFDLGLLVDVLASAPKLGIFARLAEIERVLGVPPDAALRLGALAAHVAEDADRLGARLRLSRQQQVVVLLATAPAATVFAGMPETAARALLYRQGRLDYERRTRLDWAGSDDPIDDPHWRHLHELPERFPVPVFPLTGRDLLALGMKPGAQVGRLLRTLEERWIASNFLLDAGALTMLAQEDTDLRR